jgi:ribosome-binding factor A
MHKKRSHRARQPAFYDPDNPPPEPFRRRDRLNTLLLEELASVLRDEAADPGLLGIGLLSAELSPDYRYLRLGYVAPGPGDPRAVKTRTLEALERASGFLRARAAAAVDLKRAPELRFTFLGVAVDPLDVEALRTV